MPARLLCISAAVALVAAVAGCGSAAVHAGTIAVAGTGTVKAVPNEASFQFSVTRTSPSADRALAGATAGEQRIVAAMTSNGVATRDLQTSDVSLSPNLTPEGNRVLDYTAASTVTLNVRRLALAGTLLEAALQAGANGVNGPSLTASNQERLYRAALAKAVEQARAHATVLARAQHVVLGRVESIAEGTTGGPVPLGADAASQKIDITPGTTAITATVTVTYAIAGS